jgi:hypothetical protein
MRRNSDRILAAVMALWLVAANGCGGLPLAPVVSGDGAVGSGAPAAAQSVELGLPMPPVLQPQLDQPIVEAVASVDGDLGGVVELGSVTLTIPPSAWDGDAQIKVTVPDSTKMQAQLEITPAEKNHFDTPVTLEFDARSMGQDPRVMVIFWFDPAQGQWVALPTQIDTKTGKVSTQLSHFSLYKCESELQGRAGW